MGKGKNVYPKVDFLISIIFVLMLIFCLNLIPEYVFSPLGKKIYQQPIAWVSGLIVLLPMIHAKVFPPLSHHFVLFLLILSFHHWLRVPMVFLEILMVSLFYIQIAFLRFFLLQFNKSNNFFTSLIVMDLIYKMYVPLNDYKIPYYPLTGMGLLGMTFSEIPIFSIFFLSIPVLCTLIFLIREKMMMKVKEQSQTGILF